MYTVRRLRPIRTFSPVTFLILNPEESNQTSMIPVRKRKKLSRRPSLPSAAGGTGTMRDRLSHRAQSRTSGEGRNRDRQEAVVECASQLRKIGDRYDLKQKILNAISKLLCPGT
uniref:Phorbol-12-myristate-13-acetate-induced protein 1 n=1 Tax=Geotrypetes seraphini TaxID=260995 RepID=A0A6P8QPG3_GEOSA|nr:phorbol-12-myristate-13-acetate-induced protein 1 [Geotrypetes seraphini]